MQQTRASWPADTLEGQLMAILDAFEPDSESVHPPAAQKAAQLARLVQTRATELQTPQERRQQAELERMMRSPREKATLVEMTDQAFRAHDPRRAVDQVTHILDVQGVPRFFTRLERTLMKGFQSFGSYLPGVAVPLVKEKMRAETANVILPAEDELLTPYLEARLEAGLRMNVNFLGEMLLGEEEAENRLEAYLEALQWPAIECISVKISTIYSQISSLAFEHTVAVLCDRLELLFRAAAKERFRWGDGSLHRKFVYLDMEEYRDMAVTAEAFMRTLNREGLEQAPAGLALQSYLPDSFTTQKRIIAWARDRVRAGGSPITIRIVKGANMEMERVEAAVRGWPQAPYVHKIETDANFKRMLHEGLRPENLGAVRLGVASHNLFDICYGLVLAAERGCLEQVQLEMLEGMANHQRRALSELTANLLLYAPATRKEDFIHAIGYLIRRLDENTGPDNFLRHAFKLRTGDEEWEALEDAFFDSFRLIDNLSEAPRRTQDRHRATPLPPPRPSTIATFSNEPDTDFSLPRNIEWANEIISSWKRQCDARAAEVPVVTGGAEIFEHRTVRDSLDPSRPGVVVARYREASKEDVLGALDVARTDPRRWRHTSVDERCSLLARAAHEIRVARADLIGAALAEGGKTITESDPEVSEAIDFCELYSRSAAEIAALPGVSPTPKGVAVVVSPWNFPIAIPCGGLAAALAAGNTVILKPASATVLVAHLLCQCFWRAGVPREVLQFAPCSGSSVGAELVGHADVDVVILTGGTDTALGMLEKSPGMNLLAETGGKNATIVTALSDREQAIKHVLHSAFSHAGQKCSATSLLILEREVYDDPEFRRTLCDAVHSLPVGSAWEPQHGMGPLIRAPVGGLERALKELETGESWAVMPRRLEDNPCLFSPGVKWGVQPGSFTHMTELFGPVLGVMSARDLDEAVSFVNQTGYGLTSGLESLDDREQTRWSERVRAGNLYINRPTTGAVVMRQPFGGMGKSAFGPGVKAGGPNYVAQLVDFTCEGGLATIEAIENPPLTDIRETLIRHQGDPSFPIPVDQIQEIVAAIDSYALAMRDEFGRNHDHALLLGQDNTRRYLPVAELRVRVHSDDRAFDLFARVCAAHTVGCRTTLSLPHGYLSPVLQLLERLTEGWGARIEFVEESDEELAQAIRDGQTERVRYAAPERVPAQVLSAVGDSGVYVARAPVLAQGRIELLWYVREQSVSVDYHRYGNLGARADEPRAPVLCT